MSELEDATRLANAVLDSPCKDQDSDICVLARQFLHAIEREREAELRGWEQAIAFGEKYEGGTIWVLDYLRTELARRRMEAGT